PVQPPVAGRGAFVQRAGSLPAMSADQIVLMDGKRKPQPTHYAGSVRVRATGPSATPVGDPFTSTATTPQPFVNLQISTEPMVQLRGVAVSHIAKAVNDNGQSLSRVEPDKLSDFPVGGAVLPQAPNRFGPGVGMNGMQRMPAMMGAPGLVTVHFKNGEKTSKTLTELSGTLSLQVMDTPEALITVENVLKSAGTTTKGK